jgi:transposase
VARESTSGYWKPVDNILEGSLTVFLVHAAHVKQVPGRKTDKAEARWWATLRRDGLLNARVIPPVGPRDRRDLTRYRTKLVQERGREDNRVHGVVERANITLGAVATHMFGGSGRAISAALLEGRADPATRAALAGGAPGPPGQLRRPRPPFGAAPPRRIPRGP